MQKKILRQVSEQCLCGNSAGKSFRIDWQPGQIGRLDQLLIATRGPACAESAGHLQAFENQLPPGVGRGSRSKLLPEQIGDHRVRNAGRDQFFRDAVVESCRRLFQLQPLQLRPQAQQFGIVTWACLSRGGGRRRRCSRNKASTRSGAARGAVPT